MIVIHTYGIGDFFMAAKFINKEVELYVNDEAVLILAKDMGFSVYRLNKVNLISIFLRCLRGEKIYITDTWISTKVKFFAKLIKFFGGQVFSSIDLGNAYGLEGYPVRLSNNKKILGYNYPEYGGVRSPISFTTAYHFDSSASSSVISSDNRKFNKIYLHFGAGDSLNKELTEEKINSIITTYRDYYSNAVLYLLKGPRDKHYCIDSNVILLDDVHLLEYKNIFNESTLVVCNDSGIGHYASFYGSPVDVWLNSAAQVKFHFVAPVTIRFLHII